MLQMESTEGQTNDYEKLLTKISRSGPLYRWCLTFLLAFLSMKSALDTFILNLSTAETPFHCAEVFVDNTSLTYSAFIKNYSDYIRMNNFSIKSYTCNTVHFISSTSTLTISNQTTKCTKWTFYPDWDSRWNMMMEFQMVCDRSYLANRMQTIMQSGVFTSTFFGFSGDVLGRKTLLVAFCYLDILCNFLSIFVTSLQVQMVLRFFMGFGAPAVLISVILIAEIVSEENRGVHGNMIWILWVLGYSGSAAIAYYIANWRHQMIVVVSVIGSAYFTYIFAIPESPRWLLSKRKINQAKKTLKTIAEFSGCEKVVDTFDFENNPLTKSSKQTNKGINQFIPTDNFCNKRYIFTLIILSFQFFIVSIVYYAMSFQRDFITKDPFINVAISGIIELPAYVTAWFLTNNIGRKYSTMACFLVCGVGLILLPYIPNIRIPFISLYSIVAIILKFAITTGISIICVFATELFPTNIRSMSFFFVSIILRSSQIMAPELGGEMQKLYKHMSQLVYGGVATLAGLSVLLLSETKSKPMPNTIADMHPLLWTQRSRRQSHSGRRNTIELNYNEIKDLDLKIDCNKEF